MNPGSVQLIQFVSLQLIYYFVQLMQCFMITLALAHLNIALFGGNSEYTDHQDCPPQLLWPLGECCVCQHQL